MSLAPSRNQFCCHASSLRLCFSPFPSVLGLWDPLGIMWWLRMGWGANCRHFIVPSPFTLKTFQKERSVWIVFTILLKVSSNTVRTWQRYDLSIITQLLTHTRCHLPLRSASPAACTDALQPPGSTQSLNFWHWSMPNRKSVRWMDGNKRLQEWESCFLVNFKVEHPSSPTVNTHMTLHFSPV